MSLEGQQEVTSAGAQIPAMRADQGGPAPASPKLALQAVMGPAQRLGGSFLSPVTVSQSRDGAGSLGGDGGMGRRRTRTTAGVDPAACCSPSELLGGCDEVLRPLDRGENA